MGSKINVLVVEDNKALAGVVRLTLDQAGFAPTLAPNGRVAWELLQQEHFHLVVTDYQMPEMDGKELILRMQRDERLSDLPVILLTARGLELDLDVVRDEWGVMDVMFKPFSPRELLQKIQSYLTPTEFTS